jgi:AcrR family transcriptional regulator
LYRIPRGRPRSPGHDRAILDAALDVMSKDGYARMSMDAVAQAAGVSRSAIYRRYPRGKAELATTALADLRERSHPAPTDDPRADALRELRRLRRGIERPHGYALLGTVLAEEAHTPELASLFREHVVAPRRQRVATALRRLSLRVDAEVAARMLIGSLYAARLAGERLPPSWPERELDALVDDAAPSVRGGAGFPSSLC